MTTLATFYTLLSGVVVAGTTALGEPPISTVPTAKLPALWVDVVSAEEAPIHKRSMGGERILKARVVVLMGSPGQDTHAHRWSETLAMADTLNNALLALTNSIGAVWTWTVEATPNLDNAGYWAVTATVQAAEWA